MAKIPFTASRIAAFTCPESQKQAFLWDSDTPSLGLRVTPNGKPAFVFQGSVDGQALRITIGSPTDWPIPDARKKARELQRLIDEGIDPRQERAERKAQAAALTAREARQALTFGEAWDRYLDERRPFWSLLHLRDHYAVASPGGEHRQRRPNVKTTPGPLATLRPMRLVEVTPAVVETLASKEAQVRPTRLRLALRLLKAFLRWCAEDESLKPLVDPAAASTKKVRDQAGRPGTKKDALERGQLFAWFTAVQAIPNRTINAYVQILLLTGARREELGQLKWADVSHQWEALHIRDKVAGERTIPMTAYVAHLLATLPRRNQWVFSSPTSASGRLVEPAIAHRRACQIAGVEVTLHGLRRSFGSLSEWLELPAGVVYQIMGHAPSATAEKHYRVRPLDLLKVHHQKLEDWILAEAKVTYDRTVKPGLRAVA